MAEENQQQNQSENTNDSTSHDEVSMIEQAKKLKEENTKILDEMKKERAKMEKLHSEMILGGGSRQTMPQRQPTAEEKYIEETKKAFNGLGFSPLIEQ